MERRWDLTKLRAAEKLEIAHVQEAHIEKAQRRSRTESPPANEEIANGGARRLRLYSDLRHRRVLSNGSTAAGGRHVAIA